MRLSVEDVEFLEPDPEDIAFIADTLLALCDAEREANDLEPLRTFTDDGLRLRERADRLRLARVAAALDRTTPDPLALRELKEIVARATLTERQREVLFLRFEGERFDAIGERYGSSKQAARAVFVAALTKLRRAWRDYPHAGYAEVYRFQTRRRI